MRTMLGARDSTATYAPLRLRTTGEARQGPQSSRAAKQTKRFPIKCPPFEYCGPPCRGASIGCTRASGQIHVTSDGIRPLIYSGTPTSALERPLQRLGHDAVPLRFPIPIRVGLPGGTLSRA